jgi:hypothetical protein
MKIRKYARDVCEIKIRLTMVEITPQLEKPRHKVTLGPESRSVFAEHGTLTFVLDFVFLSKATRATRTPTTKDSELLMGSQDDEPWARDHLQYYITHHT